MSSQRFLKGFVRFDGVNEVAANYFSFNEFNEVDLIAIKNQVFTKTLNIEYKE